MTGPFIHHLAEIAVYDNYIFRYVPSHIISVAIGFRMKKSVVSGSFEKIRPILELIVVLELRCFEHLPGPLARTDIS